MKEYKVKKVTPEEVNAAINMQSPLDKLQDVFPEKEMQSPVINEEKSEDVPPNKGKQGAETFKQLGKFSRDARLIFGGKAQWVKAEMLFSKEYRDGYESPPFFITKAFLYKSKAGYGERLGFEIVFGNRQFVNVGMPYNPKDVIRTQILGMFYDIEKKQPVQNAESIGPFVFKLLPTQKGNDYYDLQPYEPLMLADSSAIPFLEIDDEIPF